MENKLVVEEKIEETLTIEEVNKTPKIENVEVLTIKPEEVGKIESLKIEVPKKVNKPKKVKAQKKTEEKPAVPKPVRIEINEKEFIKAMKKVKGEIRITPLYESYNKRGKIFNGHVPSVVKTKIRTFGKKLVAQNKIKMVRAKQGNYFVYKLVK